VTQNLKKHRAEAAKEAKKEIEESVRRELLLQRGSSFGHRPTVSCKCVIRNYTIDSSDGHVKEKL